jgi:hypothetical protein
MPVDMEAVEAPRVVEVIFLDLAVRVVDFLMGNLLTATILLDLLPAIRRHFGFRHRNNFDNFGLWWPWGPLYGSYGVPYTDDDYSMGYQTPQTVKSCEHSEKTYTVPSSNGGTADVTILRC